MSSVETLSRIEVWYENRRTSIAVHPPLTGKEMERVGSMLGTGLICSEYGETTGGIGYTMLTLHRNVLRRGEKITAQDAVARSLRKVRHAGAVYIIERHLSEAPVFGQVAR